jgi:cell division septal protein FtsQ
MTNSRTRKKGGRPLGKRLIRLIRKSIWPIGLSLSFGASLFGFYLGVRHLVASSLFEVKAFQWSGLQHLHEPEMSQRFQSILGRNLFEVEIAPIQRALLSNPWVKAATVRKDFPDRLTFIVVERTPASVAYPRFGEALPEAMRLLDQEGVVLDKGGEYPPELPRVVHVNKEAYPKALRLADLFTKRSDFLIDLSNANDLRVHLPGGVLHFGGEDYPEKWNRFVHVEEDLRDRGFSNWEVDLRFPGKVIVKGDLPKIKKVRGERIQKL